jgi:cell wall-associated NlpC family hydrolase
MAKIGQKVERGNLKPGDLVLFSNTYRRGISHIGVYIGENKFVHAATSRSGVRVDSLSAAYYSRKYYGARRVQ